MSQLFKLVNILEKPLTDHVIVLDIDETLVHTFDNMKDLELIGIFTDPSLIDLRSRTYRLQVEDGPRGSGVYGSAWGITRPHLKEFLLFCFSYFRKVVVWSAGTRQYVHSIVKTIFKDIRQPDYIFSREDCRYQNSVYDKPLRLIADRINEKNILFTTFILDDRDYTGADNPWNAIIIPRYEPAPTANSLRLDDIALLQVMKWMMNPEVMRSTNVRNLAKSGIFSTPTNK